MEEPRLGVGDYDNDGRLDLLINNLDDGPVLLHNEMPQQHWLLVRCIGNKSNRSAVGARLTLRAGNLRQIREIKAGLSYLSSNDLRVHFGLGTMKRRIRSRSAGQADLLSACENIRADQILKLEEGKSPAVSKDPLKRRREVRCGFKSSRPSGSSHSLASIARHRRRRRSRLR